MKPLTIEDHKKAAVLYSQLSQGHKLNFQERNILKIYEAKKNKVTKTK